MPDNNLGTAEGRIRLEFEDRASTKATAALLKIQQQMEMMNKNLLKVQNTLQSQDQAFEKSSKSLDSAAKSVKNFSSEIFSANKSITSFIRDAQDLYENINKVQKAFDKFRDIQKPFTMGFKAVDQFNKALSTGEGRVNSLSRALTGAGIAGAVFNKGVALNMLGLKSSMKEMPQWTQNLHRYAGGLTAIAGATKAVSMFAEKGLFTKLLNTRGFVELAIASKKGADDFEKFTRSADRSLIGLAKSFDTNLKPIVDFAKTSKGFLAGTALLKSGIDDVVDRFRWLGKIPKPILEGLAVSIADVIPAALKVMGKAIEGASNLIEGLWDGAKQLAGGILVLPGLFATLGAAITPLAAVFGGLKKQFKDVFSDDWGKQMKALWSLPEALQPLAKVLITVHDKFKVIQNDLQGIAVKGLADQISQLSDTYLPKFADGATKVLLAWRAAKDEFVSFAKETQTQKDFSTLYTTTAVAIANMGRALKPVADGLRDLAIPGNQFITDMTGGIPKIAEGFAKWARNARESGDALHRMSEAEHGVFDIAKGLESAAQAAFKLTTAFRTNDGSNFLDRFRIEMDKLNKSVGTSEVSGTLAKITAAVHSMASGDIDKFKDLWKDVSQFIGRITPEIVAISQAFSATFIPVVKAALEEFGLISQAVRATGLDVFAAAILGVAAGWSAFSSIMVPIAAKLKIIVGLFMTLGNATKITAALETAILAVGVGLEKLGPGGAKVADSLVNVAGSMTKVIGVAGRLIATAGSAALALGAAWLVFDQGTQEIQKFQGTLRDSADDVVKFGQKLNKAFVADNSLQGHNVTTAITEGLDKMRQDLQATADATPGIMAKLKEGFDPTKLFDNGVSQGLQKGFTALFMGPAGGIKTALDSIVMPEASVKNMEAMGKQAEAASRGFDMLRKQGVDLSATLASNPENWDKFTSGLNKAGGDMQALIPFLQLMRNQLLEAEKSAAEMGPAGAQAAKGFDQIAKSGGDAASKLEGLKSVLQALGILQIDSLEAAAKYADVIDNLGKKIDDAVEAGGGLANLFKDGTLNVKDSQAARNLVPVFKELSDAFRQNAVSGGNVDEMVGKLNGQLGTLAEKLGISKEQLSQFLADKAGIDATPIKIAVQLDKPGLDALTGKMAETLIRLQTMAQNGGVFVPVTLGSHDAAVQLDKQLETLLGKDYFDSEHSNLTLKTGITPPSAAEMQKILAYLGQHGIDTSGIPGGAGVTGAPATIPVAPVPTQQIPGQPAPNLGDNPYGPIIRPGDINPNAIIPVPGAPQGAAPAPTAAPAPAAAPAPQDQATQIKALNDQIAALTNKDVTIKLTVDGLDKFQDFFGKMQGLDTMVQQWNAAFATMSGALNGVLGSVDTFIATIIQKFADALPLVQAGGYKFVEAYAAGIKSNQAAMNALVGLVRDLLQNVHQSPPKKGPLAAHGDAALYAGQQFGVSYAAGLHDGAPLASDAAGGIGAAAMGGVAGSSGMGTSGAGGGVLGSGGGQGVFDMGQKFGAQISKLVQFAGHAIQAFSKMGETALGFMKFVSDPLGQGTFFGKSVGQVAGYHRTPKVSDRQVERNNEDRLQGIASTMAGNATRAGIADLDPMTGMPKLGGPGKLSRKASKSDIMAAIAQQGQAAGASKEDILAALGVVDQETGGTWDPSIIGHGRGGGGADAIGLFQQTKGMWGTPEELSDPNIAIQKYWDAWRQQNGPGMSAPQRAVATQRPGGYGAAEVQKRAAQFAPQLDEIFKSGANQPSTPGAIPGVGALPGLDGPIAPRPGVKIDSSGVVNGKTVNLTPEAATTAALISQLFPEIKEIGGVRPDEMEWHPTGRGLDIMLPGGSQPESTTPSDKALGDRIQAWVAQNALALGVQGYIWQDTWRQGGTNQVGAKGAGQEKGHMNHVHISFTGKPGTGIGAQGSNLKFPLGSPTVLPTSGFGMPNVPGTPGYTPTPAKQEQRYTRDANGNFVPVPSPIPGGPGGQGLPSGARLTTKEGPNGLEVTDALTGQVIQTIPNDLKTPQDITVGGQTVGRAVPGSKPGSTPYVTPPDRLNPATGAEWTPAEVEQWKQQHPLEFTGPQDASQTDLQEIAKNGGIQVQTQQDMLSALRSGNGDLDAAITLGQTKGADPNSVSQALQTIEEHRMALVNQDTPESRAQAKQLGSLQSDIMTTQGQEAGQNPVTQAIGFLQGASGVAGDVINTIQSGIDAVGATKDIADTLIRGVQGTKDVSKMIDDVQKYITFAANIAQTTGDILNQAGSLIGAAGGASGMPGAGGPGAALQGAAQVAQLISAGLQTANAIIDLGQEAAQIAGTYIGPFLQNLAGGAAGGLSGNVKMLLDQRTNQLVAYSADNPLDKRYHDLVNQTANPGARNQIAGQINIYGGPGSDPRDDTRQMLYQVQMASMTQATSG